nr:MAG TPA: hypothetical protein [Caudoviricetes sp.]DAY23909.1 MAG TPA: hypothetical protein [Caudoviricetes sp.]
MGVGTILYTFSDKFCSLIFNFKISKEPYFKPFSHYHYVF